MIPKPILGGSAEELGMYPVPGARPRQFVVIFVPNGTLGSKGGKRKI